MKISFVRDGKKVVPTCPKCGCRLDHKEEDVLITHFAEHLDAERDARGCKCPLIGFIWNNRGKLIYA